MPIVEDNNVQLAGEQAYNYAVEGQDRPVGFKEKLTSAFRLENEVISFISREGNLPDGYASNEYDVFSKLTDEEKADKEFVRYAALSDNDSELEAVRRQVQREREDRENLTGADGVVSAILAGTLSPMSLIPAGSAVKAYKTGSVLNGAVNTALVTAGTVAASEAALHQSQLTRTGDESLLNVSGGLLLGGAIGGAVSAINKKALNQAAKEIETTFDGPQVTTRTDGDVSAAKVWGDVRVKGKAVEKAMKALSPIDPLAKVMTAASAKARRFGALISENPLEIDGFSGRSIEQAAKTKQQMYFGRGIQEHIDIFAEYKASGAKMKRKEFNRLVSMEIANPGSTGNTYAAKSANNWVKNVYDPVSKELQGLGMLGDDLDPKTATRYLNRRWNKESIAGKLPEFNKRVSSWLQKSQKLDAEDADELANEIALRIMGTPDGTLRYDQTFKSGTSSSKKAGGLRAPFKARKFLIPDEMVEEFLERDIEELAHVYLRHTVPDMEIVRTFGDNKTSIDEVLELKIQEKEIMEDYSNLAAAAKTEKARNKIIKEGQDVIAALAGMRDRIRGVYDIPEGAPSLGRRINTAFRNLNYVRLMGGVLASSIPDIGKQVMSEGFMRAFGDGFAPLVRNISKMRPIKSEMRYMGLGLETITAGRVESLADINNYALGNTKVERALEGLSSRFGNIALINQWNDAMKTSHALAMQARVYDDLMKGVFDKRLSRLGITEDEAEGIAKMLKKHSSKQGGARLFNTKNWERQDLAFAWAAAVRKESDRVVIVPGQEKPLFMSRDVGKTLLQFRSFMLSSTQRTLLSAAQGQEANALGGMLSMMVLGFMVYVFKQWDAGREVSEDPRVWISEGIDRSGALGIIMETSNTVEKISGNRFGLRSALGVSEPASRFASRSEYEALLGPTYGSALPGILRLMTAGLDEHEWKESDTSAVRRMIPFQNLTFLRQGIDAAEQKIHEGIAQ